MESPNFIESYQTEQFDFCDRVIARLDELLDAEKSPESQGHLQVGSETNGGTEGRVDFSFNFLHLQDPLNAEMHEILRQYLPKYGQKYNAFNGQLVVSQDMKVQKTNPKGGFHTWHCEQGVTAPARNLTWTLYLNDIPEGEGETEFIEYGVKVQPKKGMLCFFPASWTHTHRGNPVYSCDKYIATGWYYLA